MQRDCIYIVRNFQVFLYFRSRERYDILFQVPKSDDGRIFIFYFRMPQPGKYAGNYRCWSDDFKKEAVDQLVKDDLNWTRFLKMIAEEEYLELENRFFQLQRDSAAQRYKALLGNQPDYVQKIPLQYLASYLGITQRHLSRIRKEISWSVKIRNSILSGCLQSIW